MVPNKLTKGNKQMAFLTATTVSVLEKANINVDTNIPNDHPCFDQEQLQVWATLADALGIDFEQTGYTVRVVLGTQKRNIFTPYVGSNGKEACIFWGNVEKPLSELDPAKVDVSIEGSKIPRMYFMTLESEEVAGFSLMISKAKEDSPAHIKEYHAGNIDEKLKTLRLAYRKGKLQTFLATKFTPAIKLSALENTEVTVIGYTRNSWGNYELAIEDGRVVRANTKLNNKLATNPEITKEKPATLTVGGSYDSNGYTVFEVELETALDKELPVFDFGTSYETHNEDELYW